jgi:hypothetical protein
MTTATDGGGRAAASIRPAIAELERAFTKFRVLFKRKMPLPVITIQTRGRRAALGWYAHQRWQNGKPEGASKINICAEHLARPTLDIAEVLLHEMVHYANALDGIEDCSPNQYHRKSFKTRCDAIGLCCEKEGCHGWARTSLTPELASRAEAVGIDAEAFSLFRKPRHQAKVGSRMKKWCCSCTTIRCATELDATCRKCGQSFLRQE